MIVQETMAVFRARPDSPCSRTHWALLLFAATFVFGCNDSAVMEPQPSNEFIPLREAAPFPVGVAFQSSRLQSEAYTQIARTVFSSLTAEYEMKMRHVATGPGTYSWDNVDALVDFAGSNDMQTHGHTLVWHQSTPLWLENFGGSDEDFEAAVRDYITAIVGRYKGRVVSWDVVNEAFEDNTGKLRNSVFRQRMGDDYLARLFQYARDADPNALLFYNDYGTIWDAAKRDAMLTMLDDFRQRGIPVDGVGLQMHITYTFPPLERIEAVMDALVSRGLKVHVSELDVRVNPDGDLTVLTPERSEAQRTRVKDIVTTFMDLPSENRFAITLWGLRDGDSWLIDFWGNPEWPLLYDNNFKPKPAYEGFLEALDGR